MRFDLPEYIFIPLAILNIPSNIFIQLFFHKTNFEKDLWKLKKYTENEINPIYLKERLLNFKKYSVCYTPTFYKFITTFDDQICEKNIQNMIKREIFHYRPIDYLWKENNKEFIFTFPLLLSITKGIISKFKIIRTPLIFMNVAHTSYSYGINSHH